MRTKSWLILTLLCAFFSVSLSFAQEKTITGVVKDQDGLPLPGVNIVVKGTTNGTQTDFDGKYAVKASTGQVLEFTYVGQKTVEKTVGASSTMDVVMKQDAQALDEVVVTAGGVIKTIREQGYASTKIASEELTAGKSPNVATGLTAKVAGLQINAVSSGVNPNVTVILRGYRSITGNNQALIVVDNVIVPNSILGNLNPEDIEDITVLNGASGAALYGSSASNGALIITTKKGKEGAPEIKVSSTLTFQQVNFYPDLQNKFGSGSTPGTQEYISYENQQYGPAFDGSLVQIGLPNEQGDVQMVKYAARDDKYDFWETGISQQYDFSLSQGDEKSTTFVSGQYVNTTGTTPGDKYTRATVRLNGTRNFTDKLKLTYTTSYINNVYNTTTVTGSIYNNLLNTPAHIPLLKYKNWQDRESFSSPDNYYNMYYDNPYFAAANNRADQVNNYLTGRVELAWDATNWLQLKAWAGLTARNYESKSWTGAYTLSDYAREVYTSKSDVSASVGDSMFNTRQMNYEGQALFKTNITDDLTFKGLVGFSVRDNITKSMNVSGSGLIIDDLYNISNRTGEPGASESNYRARQYGVYGDATFAYKNMLFLHLTARNDWVSILDPDHNTFFYPAADASFVVTDAFPELKNGDILDQLKIRGGISQVGQVNLGNSTDFGAYYLNNTFSPQNGFPYGSLAGYGLDNTIYSKGLKPEKTNGYEFGFDARMWDNKIDFSVTHYYTSTKDQTLPAQISISSGYSSRIMNIGDVTNSGLEAALHVTPIDNGDWTLTVGGNFTYNENKVAEISDDQSVVELGGYSNLKIQAREGMAFPVLYGTDYERDDQGRVIVDPVTGYPTVDEEFKVLGNTQPKTRVGLDFEVRYKNLRLSSVFEYRGGYQIYSGAGSTLDFSGSSARSAQYNRERFVFPNSSYYDSASGQYVENTSITVADGGAGFWASSSYNYGVASNYVFNGQYWKWREVSLTYDFPSKLLENTPFKDASVSLQGRNLFLWTPKSNEFTDPDYNYSTGNSIGITTLDQTPPTRYFGGTVSLTF
ncbi:SusC/RagA family TonB-linked outer membrane protein [Zhouia sp. PK063]|uniref:SusC/RagA family TonB-linked outer membrane protein n=1 Tax=Zhouia sp. PK063 TaxID=3373602 RepID=UPI0037BB78CA